MSCSCPCLLRGRGNASEHVEKLCLIDGIGPFFRGVEGRKVNWSKILFGKISQRLDDDQFWEQVTIDLHCFVKRALADGYNAISLDDVSHLTHHAGHSEVLTAEVEGWRRRFRPLVAMIKTLGMEVYFTSDAITVPVNGAVAPADELENYYFDVVKSFLVDWPEVSGVVLRLGECDGLDVKESFCSQLHLRTAGQANEFLGQLLELFKSAGRRLVVRTWTVGAYPLGDLIWHRETLSRTFAGLACDELIISMKYGETDYFRYLSTNKAFFQLSEFWKVVEFQARREYEGAGEFPSFVGWECARVAEELGEAQKMIGVSVWCQTGGWHGMRRLAYLDRNALWIDLNTAVIPQIMLHNLSVEQALVKTMGEAGAEDWLALLRLSNEAVLKGLYIRSFAEQKLFFRRIRIPPLLHIYWDCIFFNHPTRKILRYFVADRKAAIDEGWAVMKLFPKMLRHAESLGLEAWALEDLRMMEGSFELFALAREYYFGEFSDDLVDRIREAKAQYKAAFPRGERQRYRVKTNFERFPIRRRNLARAFNLFLRRRRGYRLFDRLVTLHLLSFAYQLFRQRHEKAIPKFIRKRAMGIDTIMR